VKALHKGGFDCHREFVRQIFKSWKWSWKKPSYKQLQKYTPENIRRYYAYADWIVEQDLSKLKFMDEVHFVTKDVARNRALSPIGENVVLLRGEHFAETWSVSCMCSYSGETYLNERKDSNSQMDFIRFVAGSIQNGFLKKGDTLVLDNASIHGALETLEVFLMFLQLHDISLVYLPPYSPEFNPCELIFAQVKRFLRTNRNMDIDLLTDIAAGFAVVSPTNIQNYYNKCCRPP